MADVGYKPTSGGAPALRISKGWVVAGAMSGCVVGTAIGMGFTTIVMRAVRALWLMPILFFSPAVLGLVLGGFAGLAFARRRAAGRPRCTEPNRRVEAESSWL